MTTSAQAPLRVRTFLPAGSSTPIVVEDAAGQPWLVKLRGGQSGSYAYLCEWIAGRLGAAIGLPLSVPATVVIDDTLQIGSLHEEIRDLIAKSYGLNLAFPFFDRAAPCPPKEARTRYDRAAQQLFLYDIFLQNTDRTLKNPNLLELDGGVFSFDYEASFLIMGIVQDRDFSRSDFVLQALRENPLCHGGADPDMATDMFARLRTADLHAIVESLPEAWAAAVDSDVTALKNKLENGLRQAIDREPDFFDTWKMIGTVSPESEEDKRKRREANRIRFENGLIPIELEE